MSVPNINGGSTSDQYTDANTVIFSPPVDAFQLQVSNNPVLYQIATPGQSGGLSDVVWESLEHQMLPSFSTFDQDDARKLGARQLAGIKVRSGRPGNTASITVI